MRVREGSISYGYFACVCVRAVAARMAVGPSKKSASACRGESRNELRGLKLGGYAMRGAVAHGDVHPQRKVNYMAPYNKTRSSTFQRTMPTKLFASSMRRIL